MDNDREHAFKESDVRLLQTLASSMSVALENARLFDEVQKKNAEITETLEQQTATSNVLRVIADSPTEIRPVLEAVAENAARLCDANDVQIYQVDGDSLRQITHHGPLPALQDGEALPLVPGLVTGRAVLERRIIHIEDSEKISKSDYPESVKLQKRLKHRTTLAAPLLKEGSAIGAIVVAAMKCMPSQKNKFPCFRLLLIRQRSADFTVPLGKVAYHAACRQRVQNVGAKTREVLALIPHTESTAIERCSGHDGTYAVKKEFHEFSMKIVRPVVNLVKKAEVDHYGSDCPMAGHHIEHGMADGSHTEHPMSLLRKAYGI